MNEMLPDIPRIYTALAEWIACVIYILPLKKRLHGAKLVIALAVGALIQVVVQVVAGLLPLPFWIPGMIVAVLVMYCLIFVCCDVSPLDAGYCCVRAFITAEFAASLEWQLYCYFVLMGMRDSLWLSVLIILLLYAVVFVIIYLLESKRMPTNRRLGVSGKEFGSALMIAFAAFLISNVSFAFQDSVLGLSTGTGILFIRTLVDFSGLTMLFAQQEQRSEMRLKYELEAMNNVLHRQYEQYTQSKDSIDLINRKHHDLKHQLSIIRNESDPVKKASYLVDMDQALSVYEAQNITGNSVLDTVLTGKSLYCADHDINLTCVADGSLLDFLDVMDICTIFGNALDNAIESVEKLPDTEKRLIRVAVFAQNQFLMLRFENYYDSPVEFVDGLPATTKKDTDYHGYGIKSIQRSAEKYGGNITIHTENNWFIFRILIPLP